MSPGEANIRLMRPLTGSRASSQRRVDADGI